MGATDVLDRPVSLGQTAKAIGVSKGTVNSWRSRGHIEQVEYSLSDVLSLAVGVRLTKFGMHIEPAAEIAFQLKSYWPEFLTRKAEDRPLWLVVRPGTDTVFQWDVLDADTLIERFEDDNLIVNLRSTFIATMDALRAPTVERTTTNGTLAFAADPLPEPDDRELA